MAFNAAASTLASGAQWREARRGFVQGFQLKGWEKFLKASAACPCCSLVPVQGLLLTASTAGETTQVTLGAAARACPHLKEKSSETG